MRSLHTVRCVRSQRSLHPPYLSRCALTVHSSELTSFQHSQCSVGSLGFTALLLHCSLAASLLSRCFTALSLLYCSLAASLLSRCFTALSLLHCQAAPSFLLRSQRCMSTTASPSPPSSSSRKAWLKSAASRSNVLDGVACTGGRTACRQGGKEEGWVEHGRVTGGQSTGGVPGKSAQASSQGQGRTMGQQALRVTLKNQRHAQYGQRESLPRVAAALPA